MESKYGDYYHHPGEQNTANENILESFQRLCAEAGFRMTDSYGLRKYTIASIPMATRATKISAPVTALSPVLK